VSSGETYPGASAETEYLPAATPVKLNRPFSSVLARGALDALWFCACKITVTPRAGSPFNVTRPETVAVPTFVSAA
jgi:hypothetical protein